MAKKNWAHVPDLQPGVAPFCPRFGKWALFQVLASNPPVVLYFAEPGWRLNQENFTVYNWIQGAFLSDLRLSHEGT